jgi:hypothetical protein
MCGIEAYETESCMVACPMDCLMSPWTEWGLCDSICGVGLKNRTSKVLENLFVFCFVDCISLLTFCHRFRCFVWPALEVDRVRDHLSSMRRATTLARASSGHLRYGPSAIWRRESRRPAASNVAEDEKQGQLG